MTTNVRVMVPVDIVASMLKASTTIPEPDLARGEVAWVASGTYVINNQRTFNGSVWNCKLGHTGRAATPDLDPNYWYREGPSNRMAPFDDYANTKAVGTGSMTFVFQPGFINGLKIYGLEGGAYSLTIKDSPGGEIVRFWSGDLYSQAAGFYELLFAPLLPTEQLSFDDIPLLPNAEVAFTVTAAPGARVAVGTIKAGDWRPFVGDGDWGGTEYGAQSERKSYTLRQYNDDGTYRIVRRAGSRNISCTIAIEAEQAMYADALLGEIMDIAVPIEATNLPGYGYLNTVGFVTATIRADSPRTASINLKVEGNI